MESNSLRISAYSEIVRKKLKFFVKFYQKNLECKEKAHIFAVHLKNSGAEGQMRVEIKS